MKIFVRESFFSHKFVIAICLWIILEGILCSDICGPEEEWCTLLDENEKLAYEAIRCLHRQLDDNKDGSINLDESDDFLREELKYEKDYEKRQKVFHSNNDNQVSVRELWDTWVRSEVHNWTEKQTLEWLGLFVGLPQYEPIFSKNAINGTFLPRLAVNHQQFLTSALGVKDLIHKQKISLKAQDVVLFGPPKDYNNHVKDMILTSLLAVAILVCWFVYIRYKTSQRDLNKMIKDMELLATAEKELQDLQKEMERTKAEKQSDIEEQSKSHRASFDAGIHQSASEEILSLKGEVEVLRSELQRAELELQDKCWVPPPALQHWLQLTYELELKSYNKKKQSAEKQLRQAKDACDKLKKKRSSLMGAFVSTHGRSIDDVDKAISEARTSLTDVTQELQERMHRWKQIEMLVNCPIMNNAGLAHLETILRSYGKPSFPGLGSVMSSSQDDIDDDGASSIYCPSAVHKLVSQSTYMMYPAHQTPHSVPPLSRHFSATHQQQSPSADLATNLPLNFGGGSTSFSINGNTRSIQSATHKTDAGESLPSSSKPLPHSQTCQNPLSSAAGEDMSSEPCSFVSVPVSRSHHLPIVRSKSVSNMSSLRERSLANSPGSEVPSKDFSHIEDEFAGGPFEMKAVPKDRRVTFGIQDRSTNSKRETVTVGKIRGNNNAIVLVSKLEAAGDNNTINGLQLQLSTRKERKTDSVSNDTEQSEEKNHRDSHIISATSLSKEEPDLIKLASNSNNSLKIVKIKAEAAPALKGENETKIANGVVVDALKQNGTIIDTTTDSTSSAQPTMNGNGKKSSVWKRFANFVTNKSHSFDGPSSRNMKHSSGRNRHKVFSSELMENPTAVNLQQQSFANGSVSTEVEKKEPSKTQNGRAGFFSRHST